VHELVNVVTDHDDARYKHEERLLWINLLITLNLLKHAADSDKFITTQ